MLPDLELGGGYGVNEGLQRFVIGLGKKVIIANQMAIFADKAFTLLDKGELTTGFAWMGALAYTLQIYFDFSGYSDMAIGMGRIFGFRFLENFNYPYISGSITEFWRRWHMSLSLWFRDYVYIPLGGNRCSKSRMLLNLFIVWILTGIWHGANYTFWLWGLCYFLLLMVEKLVSYKIPDFLLKKAIGHIYTMLAVLLLWVVFRADSVSDAGRYIGIMFGGASAGSAYALGVTGLYIRNFIGFAIIGIIGSMPLKRICAGLESKLNRKCFAVIRCAWVLAVFFIACCMTLDGDYNPFVYFNF